MAAESPASSQVARIQQRLGPAPARGAGQPQVIVPSALRLTRQLEDDLLQHAKRRKEDLERDLGRMNYHAADFFSSSERSYLQGRVVTFMGRQHLGHLVYQGELDWRAAVLGGIWEDTNIHFPITRRIMLQQIARAIALFTGNTPWFTAYDVGLSDKELAEKIERWIRSESEDKEFVSIINAAITLAFVQGQTVVKTTKHKRVDFYQTFEDVAVDANGEPLIANDGDYIFRRDTFVQVEGIEGLVLKRDMNTPHPENLRFVRKLIERQIVHYDGAKSAIVPFLDFLAPLTYETLEDCDCVIHLFNEPLIRLLQRFITADLTGAEETGALSPQKQLERLSEMLNMLMPGSPGQADLAGQHQSQPSLKEAEQTTGVDTVEPMGSFAETYLHYDANGDGIQESILLITDSEYKVPIYYDYVANVTPDGKRPFSCIRVNAIPGRWHGQSQVEIFWNLQETIDLFINRMHLGQMSAGRVDFWNPQMTIEGQSNPNLELNWGATYTARDQTVDPSKILSSVYLRDIKYSELRDFIELLIQIAINMSGVSNVNDGNMANLDTSKLATGIKNLEASGQELFGIFLSELRPGIKHTLQSFATTTLVHLDKTRSFKYFEGDNAVLAQITPEEVRDLHLDVEIDLSQVRSLQDAQQGQAAWSVAQAFYMLTPEVQALMAPLARSLLKAYQQKNADEIIAPLAPPMLPPAAGDAPAAAAAAEPPPMLPGV